MLAMPRMAFLLSVTAAFTAVVLSAQPRPAVHVFVGARLVDGTGAAPVDRAVLVVSGDKILSIATMSEPGTIPSDAERVDVRGKTIMPGFVNAHGHVGDTQGLSADPKFYTRDNLHRQLALYGRYGVTTVFSLGGDGPAGVGLRNEPPFGHARLFIAGPVITASTAQGAAAEVEKIAAMGVDWLKFRVDDNLGASPKMPKAAWKTVIDMGHARQLPVAAHIFYLDDAKDLLREGIDLIAHSVRDKPVDDEFITLAKSREVCVVPTLTREVSTFVYESTPAWFTDEFFLRHADAKLLDELKSPARQERMRKSESAQKYKAALGVATENLKKMKAGGVRIAMGTDTGPPARFQGYFEHMELEMMVKAGLTPMQAIVAATSDAARCMKKGDTLGVLRPGAFADFVIYRDDPTSDIRATRTIESVWVGGHKVP
jgi:imidazolonepropionase-like amidohydrolase